MTNIRVVESLYDPVYGRTYPEDPSSRITRASPFWLGRRRRDRRGRDLESARNRSRLHIHENDISMGII